MARRQMLMGAAVATLLAMGARADDPAMTRLSSLDGVWRGQATMQTQAGPHTVIQTERVGPLVGGEVKVIEGRGFNPDGSVGFNALAIVSYDAATQKYAMRAYAQGHAGTFALEPTSDGFTWEIAAGPMTMRYSAVVKDGAWHEEGVRILPGKDPVKFFEMDLKRIGDTNWPAGTPVPMK